MDKLKDEMSVSMKEELAYAKKKANLEDADIYD
jgi:hypothetical protein